MFLSTNVSTRLSIVIFAYLSFFSSASISIKLLLWYIYFSWFFNIKSRIYPTLFDKRPFPFLPILFVVVVFLSTYLYTRLSIVLFAYFSFFSSTSISIKLLLCSIYYSWFFIIWAAHFRLNSFLSYLHPLLLFCLWLRCF